jgi:histidinol-phosphatase (PHP family)
MISLTSDNHIHTKYSPDADQEANFEAYIERAKELGLESITFTDHVDFDAKHPLFYNMIDYDQYIKDFLRVKNSTDFPIKLGVEIGYQSHMKDEINAFIDKYPFDYVIVSIHYVEQQDLYTQEFYKNKTKEQAYQSYFDLCLEAVENVNTFDVFGHLDYITRYSPYGDFRFDDYRVNIEAIIDALIKRGKGIEINTSGIKQEGRMYPKKEVVDMYIRKGGNKIYCGSDSHSVSELGRYFDRIHELF